MDVKIYTAPTCGYCHQAKRFLASRGIAFKEYDVSIDPEANREVRRLTGQMGVPVIVIDGHVVIGFDRPRLEELLSKVPGTERPRLGVKVADASKIARKAGGVPIFGVLVGAVGAGSVGERAGLRPGDIITAVNLRPIASAAELERVIAQMMPGGRLTIEFLRGDQKLHTEAQM